MISESFRQKLLKRLEQFEQRIVYLHFYEGEDATLEDKDKMQSDVNLIKLVSSSLEAGIFGDPELVNLRELNKVYERYKNWFDRVKKQGHKVSSFWNI